MRQGLKQVGHRRGDALAGVTWDRLEHLLADYYRGVGYVVEHLGTGGTNSRFDGGVDLRLQREGRVVLVQVKHWNAYQVPHNEVHQLIGLMVNARADAAILVTSGEFTKAAIEAATRNGLVQLIDGDELRAMLGEVPAAVAAPGATREFAIGVGQHLLHAAIDRALPAGRKAASHWAKAAAIAALVKLAGAVVLVLAGYLLLQATLRNLGNSLQGVGKPATAQPAFAQGATRAHPLAASATAATAATASASDCLRNDARTGVTDDRCTGSMPRREPTAAEAREARRKADAAMDVLRDSTPEM